MLMAQALALINVARAIIVTGPLLNQLHLDAAYTRNAGRNGLHNVT